LRNFFIVFFGWFWDDQSRLHLCFGFSYWEGCRDICLFLFQVVYMYWLSLMNWIYQLNTYLFKEKKKSGHISNVIVCFIFVLIIICFLKYFLSEKYKINIFKKYSWIYMLILKIKNLKKKIIFFIIWENQLYKILFNISKLFFFLFFFYILERGENKVVDFCPCCHSICMATH